MEHWPLTYILLKILSLKYHENYASSLSGATLNIHEGFGKSLLIIIELQPFV